jgi:hypothetical protein
MVFAGLIDLQAGSPIELTAPMAKGFDMGVVVVLDYVESLATFFTHPSHDEYVQRWFSLFRFLAPLVAPPTYSPDPGTRSISWDG